VGAQARVQRVLGLGVEPGTRLVEDEQIAPAAQLLDEAIAVLAAARDLAERAERDLSAREDRRYRDELAAWRAARRSSSSGAR
jgi:hypothetical protein